MYPVFIFNALIIHRHPTSLLFIWTINIPFTVCSSQPKLTKLFDQFFFSSYCWSSLFSKIDLRCHTNCHLCLQSFLFSVTFIRHVQNHTSSSLTVFVFLSPRSGQMKAAVKSQTVTIS